MGVSLAIHKAGLADLEAVAKLSSDTFFETYEAFNSKASMDQYLRENFNLHQMEIELSDPGNQFFLAYAAGQLVGYIKLRTSVLLKELKEKKAIEIERIYVLKAFQGKNFGAALLQYGIELAAANGFETVWLGVWIQNTKAIGFYKNLGFEVFGTHIFYFGDDPQEDYLMKKELL
ncbi:MAG: GNAT family N-acetyltransferase [Saprospiraceae bacterium]|nr:GNAT family N-acetyltransferase [Saprospiraceae bacterium]